MPRLYILSGPDLGRTIDVQSGATLGRAPEAAVQLRDASVSRHHAKLELREGAWRIVDAGSRNGITLRGARVTDAALVDGDEFQVGEVQLRFRTATAAPRVPAAPAAPGARKIETEPDEITLEEDPVEALPSPAPMRPPAPALDRTVANVRRTMQPESRGQKVLQYKRIPDRQGFFASDLAQQPLWIKLGAVVLALLVSAAIFLFAFKGTSFLKARTTNSETSPAE
jgi:hypothetical protein